MGSLTWRSVWALGALVALAYTSVLAGGETFAHLGWLGEVTPARYAAGDAIAGGRVPGWWSEAGFGVALLAEPQHGALYPPAWLAALGGRALDVVAILHLWLLAAGTAALSRRLGADTAGGLLAGAAVALSAMAAGALVGGALFTLAWAPLAADRAFALARAVTGPAARADADGARGDVRGGTGADGVRGNEVAGSVADGARGGWFVAQRARRVRLALEVAGCLTACALGGMPVLSDAAIGTVLVAGLARGGWRALAWCGAAVVASLLLAAIQIAPALILAAGGHTAGVAWDAPGVALFELAAPGVSGAHGALYGGGAAVVALALCTRSRWLAVPAVLVLASLARPPIAALAWAWIAALAGAGLGVVTREPPSRTTIVPPAVVLGVLATLLIALAAARYPLAAAVDRAGLDGAAVIEHAQWRGVIALGFAAAALALAIAAAHRRDGALIAVAALVALAEVAIAGRTALPRRPRDAADPPLVEALARAAPTRVLRNIAPVRGEHDERGERDATPGGRGERDATPRGRGERAQMTLDAAIAHAAAATMAPRGVAAVPGTDPARLALEDRLPAATASVASRMLDRYAIEHALVPATVVTAADVTQLAQDRDEALVATAPRRPRGFWVSRWAHASDDEVLAAFAPPPGQAAAPLGTVFPAGRGDSGGDMLAAPRPCTVARPHAGEVRLTCDVTAPGYAVLLDAWAPGWTATVDGRDVAVERADLIARAVRVGPGARVIVFRYTPPGFWLGAAVSALALLNAGLLVWLTRRRG